MRHALALTLLCLLPAAAAQAQQPGFDLSVANIMRGPELVGTPPEDVQWSADSRWIYFRWKPGGRPWHDSSS